MRGPAYLDFAVRLREVLLLTRFAAEHSDARMAAACSKSATVLLAAALERYVNDALDAVCRSITAQSWEDLPKGFQGYLLQQISKRLHDAIDLDSAPTQARERTLTRLRAAVDAAAAAFKNPSEWSPLDNSTVFMNGAVLPKKLDGLLRVFHPEGKPLLDAIEKRGLDRGVFVRSLADLVDNRHATAHAESGHTPPSTNDVKFWISIVFRLVRIIESYLEECRT